MAKKTDNHNPKAKLDLRRYFLRKYHADGEIRVFDCCQGSGLLWRTLRNEFDVTSYWGVDQKPKAGRLKIDSARVLVQPGMRENVIDIDTYGSPWKHWAALLPTINRDMTVFLTIGFAGPNQIRLGRDELNAMGLTLRRVHSMSGAITHKLLEKSISYCLTMACVYCKITEAVEAVSDGNARYVGVRLETKKPEVVVATPGGTQAKLKRSKAHV